METTTKHRIAAHAPRAAYRLARGLVSVETLEPGDMTRYVMVLAEVPDDHRQVVGGGYILSIPNFGVSYPVGPGYVSPDYAASKWGGGNLHTGEVVAEYLNAVFALLTGDEPTDD